MSRQSKLEAKSLCQNCQLKESGLFCQLSPNAFSEFKSISSSSLFSAGVTLFRESEIARGVFLLCSGSVKLSISSSSGKTLTMRIARPGEILGLTATMAGSAYETSAEALYPSQVTFIRRNDFMSLLGKYPEVYQSVIQQLNSQYRHACQQLRTVGLAYSAHERLARLLLQWSSESGKEMMLGTQTKVSLTHEQIAECMGSTRETVTRTLSEFRSKGLVRFKGATMMIPDRGALEAVCGA